MNEAERDAWLAELWPVCRELPREERAAKRQADWEARIRFDDRSPQADVESTSEAA
jgi:hypothetical protein